MVSLIVGGQIKDSNSRTLMASRKSFVWKFDRLYGNGSRGGFRDMRYIRGTLIKPQLNFDTKINQWLLDLFTFSVYFCEFSLDFERL